MNKKLPIHFTYKLVLLCILAVFTAFQAVAATPVITSFSPSSGAVGTTVTITGTGFNTTAAGNIVFFGATQATVSAASATSLTVTVPLGATYNNISVLNTSNSLSCNSLKPFVVTFTGKSALTVADFQPYITLNPANTPRSIAAADFDGDGKPDIALIAVNSSNVGTLSIFRNISTAGSLSTSSFAAKVDFAGAGNCTYITTADMDGDGKLDVIVANGSGNTVSVFRNTSTTGNISFANKVDYLTNSNGTTVKIADLDGDGKPDMVIPNNGFGAGNTVSILRNTSITGTIDATSFATKVDLPANTAPYGLSIGDIDGDGKPDLVVTTNSATGNTVSVYQNTSVTGSINLSSFASKVDFTTGSTPYGVVLGDFDGDGKLDMATANSGSNTVSFFRNTSASGTITTSSFAAKVDVATNAAPRDIVVSDVDGDGLPDVITGDFFVTSATMLRNISTGSTIAFSPRVDFTVGSRPIGVVLCDFDGDGKPDLATCNNVSLEITILRNNPLNPSSAITFSNTTGTSTTASWTSGNAASRAVFLLAGSTGSPAPVNNTTYTGNAAFKSGTQIGSSGWYCVYNGSGNSVNITGLTSGTTYRLMVMEYNGTAGSELYLTTSATNNPNNVTPVTPVITSGGSLAALASTYGTASSSGTFSVAGTNIASGITITPPSGFEISTDNVTFSNTGLTIGTTGTIASTTIFVRLIATDLPGSYSGNITLTSLGAVSVTVSTASSTIAKAPLSITANNVTKFFGTSLSGTGNSTAFTSSGLVSGETIGSVTISYGTGSSASDPINIYPGSVIPSAAAGGTFNGANYNITYVAGSINVITPVVPAITVTGSAPALSTTYGVSSASSSFNISGIYLTSGITATAPTGYELSSDNLTFSSQLTIGSAGTVASTPIYIRLSSANPVGSYSGNIVLTSPGASTMNAPTIASTVTPATLTVKANNVTKIYGTILSSAANSTAFTATGLKNGELIGTVSLNLGAGGQANSGAGTYNGTVLPSLAAGGTFSASNYIINYAPGNITVNPATLTITASNITKNYGVNLTNVSGSTAFTASGLQNGETIGSVNIAYGTGATAATVAGTYPGSVVPSAPVGGTFLATNYVISYVAGNIIVISLAPTAITLAATSVSSTAATISGSVNDNGASTNVTLLYGTSPSLSGAATATLNSGTSPLGAGTGITIFNSALSGLVPGTTYYYSINASNSVGTVSGSILSFKTLNNNATLANLVLSNGTLTPNFTTGIYNYSATVDNNVGSLSVTPTLTDASASVTVNGSAVVNGSTSGPITLNLGDNLIRIIVTAQDGSTIGYNSVTVHRSIAQDALVGTNILTPNGDGTNDYWVIKDITLYPNNTVTVYDRSGRVVYSKKGYSNDWNGSYKGVPLSEDTYYYVVSLGDNLRSFKGYITILRKR